MVAEGERWHARPSGNMTLSVVSSTGEQILRVGMLSQGTMRAGLSGNRLARALNDLSLAAGMPELLSGSSPPNSPARTPGIAPCPGKWMRATAAQRAPLLPERQ